MKLLWWWSPRTEKGREVCVKMREASQDMQRICKWCVNLEVSGILCYRGVKGVRETWAILVKASWEMWETNVLRTAINSVYGPWNTVLNLYKHFCGYTFIKVPMHVFFHKHSYLANLTFVKLYLIRFLFSQLNVLLVPKNKTLSWISWERSLCWVLSQGLLQWSIFNLLLSKTLHFPLLQKFRLS